MLLNIEGNPVVVTRVLRSHQISGQDWVPGLRPLCSTACWVADVDLGAHAGLV
jgi:hypothetical protein